MKLIYTGFLLLKGTLFFFNIKHHNMIPLLLCIVSSTLIFVIFKYISHYNVPALPVIIINYLVASALGFIISGNKTISIFNGEIAWLPLAVVIGILFILMFFIIGKSTQTAGISVTTVASKLSVVIPIVFSLASDSGDNLNMMKFIGIAIALLAVFLTIYRKKGLTSNIYVSIYPIVLFFGMGFIDSLVKYAQMRFINDNELSIFTAFIFLIAFLTGILYLVLKPLKNDRHFSPATMKWGILLGLSNFGSIYFIIKALNFKSANGAGIDSSVVFGVNNTSIVVLSVIAGYLIFNERLIKINYAGIVLALVAIILFAHA